MMWGERPARAGREPRWGRAPSPVRRSEALRYFRLSGKKACRAMLDQDSRGAKLFPVTRARKN